MTIERMFLAVTPPKPIVDLVDDLPSRAQRGVRWTKKSQWHVTMRFLGDCDRDEALVAFAGFSADSATAELGPAVTMLGPRVVVIPVVGLEAVAAAIDASFATVGEPTEREFYGHLTLARLKGQPLRDPSLVSLLDTPVTGSFPVESVELWKSELGPDGATHTLVATQELGDSAS